MTLSARLAATLRLWLLCLALPAQAATEALPAYQAASLSSGSLSSLGSDTLANALGQWAALFGRYHPEVRVQFQASGSAAAPPALTEGTIDLAPMSRLMHASELAQFERRYGYPPLAVPVALDAVALYVHRDNPLAALNLQQVDALFSATRRCGQPERFTSWGQFELPGYWAQRRVRLVGRNAASGTYGFFKSRALCGGDFLVSMQEQPGSASVVLAVGSSLAAIGFAGIGYDSASVRAVPLSQRPGEAAIEPSWDAAASGAYPLARLLYIYINQPPQGGKNAVRNAFLALILSAEGQALVREAGLYPLPRAQIEQARESLGL
jgi:phosphate transport system substrate-binding protein